MKNNPTILYFDWELIDRDDISRTYRAKVWNGWILRYEQGLITDDKNQTSLLFVPDSNHEWIVED